MSRLKVSQHNKKGLINLFTFCSDLIPTFNLTFNFPRPQQTFHYIHYHLSSDLFNIKYNRSIDTKHLISGLASIINQVQGQQFHILRFVAI